MRLIIIIPKYANWKGCFQVKKAQHHVGFMCSIHIHQHHHDECFLMENEYEYQYEYQDDALQLNVVFVCS